MHQAGSPAAEVPPLTNSDPAVRAVPSVDSDPAMWIRIRWSDPAVDGAVTESGYTAFRSPGRTAGSEMRYTLICDCPSTAGSDRRIRIHTAGSESALGTARTAGSELVRGGTSAAGEPAWGMAGHKIV